MQKPQKQLITEGEVKQLLKLEELFHSQSLTEELLSELISTYVRFVDGMDNKQIAMRAYFLERIGFVLSRKEVIKLLEK